jgi:hypothetical protein
VNPRRLFPPLPVALGFLLVVVGRVVNSQLMFGEEPSWPEALMNAAMMATLATFWCWPPSPLRLDWVAVRLTALLVVIYAVMAPLLPHEPRLQAGALYILSAYIPFFNFLLALRLARLFAHVRVDSTLPETTALGPCALFFLYALVVPAAVQSLRPGAPRLLTWLLLGVPLVSALCLGWYLRDRRRAGASVGRELGVLLWRTIELPLLFVLGQFSMILALVRGTG